MATRRTQQGKAVEEFPHQNYQGYACRLFAQYMDSGTLQKMEDTPHCNLCAQVEANTPEAVKSVPYIVVERRKLR